MNPQAIQDAYTLFVRAGYKKDIESFKNLIKTNPNALNDAHTLFAQHGYKGGVDGFKVLMGLSDEELKKKDEPQPSGEESTEPQEQPTTPSASPTPKAPLPSTPNELLYTGALGGLKRNEPIAGVGKPLKQKQEPIDVTYTPEEMPSETTQGVVPIATRRQIQEAESAEKDIEKGQLPANQKFVNEGTAAKVEKQREKLGMNTLEEAAGQTLERLKENNIKEMFSDVSDEVDDYIKNSPNNSGLLTSMDYDLGSGKAKWKGFPGLGGKPEEIKQGESLMESQAKRGEILKVTMDDYFGYLDKTNPSQAEYYRNKYNVIKSSKDRDNNDEKFLQEIEGRALKLRAAAIKKDLDVYKTALDQYSQIEKRVNFQGFDNDVKELKQSAKTLNNLYQSGKISEEDYKVRFNQIQQGFEKARIKNGFTPEVEEKLNQAKSIYFGYGQEAMKLSSIFGFMDQNSKEYRQYNQLQKDIEEAKKQREDAWNSASWFEKMYMAPAEFARSFSGGVGNMVLDILQAPKVLEEFITGDTNYNFLDEWYDGIENFQLEKSKQFGETDSNSIIQYLTSLGGNAISSISVFGLGGSLGGTSKMAKFGSTFTTAFLAAEAGAYEEAMSTYKMSPRQAASAATAVATATALVEGLIPDIKYFEPGPYRASILRAISEGKTVSQAAREALPESAKAYLKTGIKEGGEEIAGQLSEDVTKSAVNLIGQSEYYKDLWKAKSYRDSFLGGFIGGTVMNVFQRPVGASPISEDIMLTAAENADAIMSQNTNEKINSELKSRITDARKDFQSLQVHPNWSSLDRTKQAHVFGITQQIRTLESSEIKDPIIKAQIDKLKSEREEILSLGANGIDSRSVGTATTPQRVMIGGKSTPEQSKEIEVLNQKMSQFVSPRVSQLINEKKITRNEAEAIANKEWSETNEGKRRQELLNQTQGQQASFFINEDGDYEIEYTNGRSVVIPKGEGAADKIREMGIKTDDGEIAGVVKENQNTLITPTLEKGATVDYNGKNAIVNGFKEKDGKVVYVNLTTEDGKTLQIREGQPGPGQDLLNNLNALEYDQKNEVRISSQVGEGQKPIEAQPIQGAGTETTETSGVLQTSEESAQRVSDILSDIYFNEPGGRNGGLLDEGDANAASALQRANAEGGNQYSAHGMGKSSIASAFKDLFTLLTKGIDPTRGGGRLYTAPLSGGEQGAGAGVGTATGNAYMDGPFTLVANRGVGSITDVSQIGGIIVNDGLVNARPELLNALREAFPGIIFESTSNTDQLVRQLNERSQQATQSQGQQKPTSAKETVAESKPQEEVELKPAELPTTTIEAEVVEEKPVTEQPTSETEGETTATVGGTAAERMRQRRGKRKGTPVAETQEKPKKEKPKEEKPATGETKVSEVAPSVRPARAVEASEGSNPEAGEDSALEAAGMTREERDEWKKNNKAQGKKPKIEQLTQAVKDLVSGKKSFKDYYRMAKELMPSKLMDKVPTAATFKEIIGAIDSNKLKIGIVGLNKFVKKGMRVGLRIDIPSFNNHGKNVVTVHDRSKSGQEVIGYGSTGSIKNVNFRTSVPTAAKIGTGETSKSAFAMAEGEWMDESPESIQKRAEEAMNSPEWVQVSMNPARNSFFFDKADGNPVVSADEVLQVGNLVLAKNPKKIDLNTAEGMAEFERMFSTTDKKTGVTYQYRTAEKTIPGEVKTGRKFTGRAAVNRVVDFLKKANIDVELVSDDRFKEVQKGTALTGSLDGLFFTDEKSGKIYLRESKVDTHFGDILAFHEGIHPVMNIVAKTNPKLYDAIHDGLQNLAKENSETGREIRRVIETQKRFAEENGWDPSTLKDEIIVEALAIIAAKGLSIPQSQRGLRNAIIDFLNKIAKILNIPTKSRNVTDADFRAFVKKLSNAIREGGDIGDVINKRDIAAEAFSNTVTQDISAKGSTRSAVEKNPVYFENIKVFASQSSFDNKIQFKKAVQDLFNSYIPELKKKYGKAFNPSKNNALTKQYLSDIITDEAVRAINEHPEAIGWYDEKTRAALDVISAIHPEIATDKEARGSFILPLAVMSNGNLVDFNFDLAEKQYDYFKKNGRFNPVGGFGLQQSGIKKSLLLINSLLDNGLTMSDINTFLTSKYRAGDLKVNVDGKTKSLASGELADEMVYGAVILGPKIGNGFYMNLWGQFDQLTMDRWFMRTWGRLTGTLLKIDNNAITDGKKRISNALYAIKSDPEALKILKSIVPKLSGVSTADLAKIIEKASMKKDKRAILASNPKTDELRKAGNSLSKSMSGEKEAPANGNERKFIRDVFTDVARRLKEENNIDITMADLQAVLWYPEKILYESFKEGETFEEASEGYTSESAPDYFNAAKKLAIKLGVNETEINQALSRGRERTKRSVGETDSTAGNTVSEANKEALKKVADTIGKFKQEESKTKTSSKPSVSQERDMEPSLVDEAGLTKNMTEDGNGNYVFYHKTNKPLKTIDPKFFGRTLATSRDERPGVGISMYYTRPDAGESMVTGQYGYIVRVPKDKVYPINEDPLNLYDEAKRMFEKDYPGQAFDANKQVGYITKLAGQKGFPMTVTKWQKGPLALRAQSTTALKPEVHYSPIPGYSNAIDINEEIDAIEPNEVKMRREKRRAKGSASYEREMEPSLVDETKFSDNSIETIDRVKSATGEDGATINLDGTDYSGGGLVVPAGSKNVRQSSVSVSGLYKFLQDNLNKISSDIFKIGLYRFPDRPEVSYDLNIVIPSKYREIGIEFGRLAGQESLFDLDTYENVKTGATGENPIEFTAEELAEIAIALSQGKMPNIPQKGITGTAKASIAQDRGMDPELAYNEVDRLIEDGENSGMNGQQMYDSISKTEAYASLSPEDRSLVNDTLRSMGAVTSDPAASSIMSYDAGEKAAVLDALRDNKDLAYIYRNFREILTDLKEKGIIETDCI